ncbi:hypothetical protein TREES_T100013298 [Tupaia chinensis]|uniref:Uncharacterized protein n=1 Tax=Tupaia chinensis TaxID=246437 RepID=L9KPY9_TUPCH|nr:hypothetical protein TREES_T100013298 [Tupaia chinensis]
MWKEPGYTQQGPEEGSPVPKPMRTLGCVLQGAGSLEDSGLKPDPPLSPRAWQDSQQGDSYPHPRRRRGSRDSGEHMVFRAAFFQLHPVMLMAGGPSICPQRATANGNNPLSRLGAIESIRRPHEHFVSCGQSRSEARADPGWPSSALESECSGLDQPHGQSLPPCLALMDAQAGDCEGCSRDRYSNQHHGKPASVFPPNPGVGPGFFVWEPTALCQSLPCAGLWYFQLARGNGFVCCWLPPGANFS